jgi:hypothetical protein
MPGKNELEISEIFVDLSEKSDEELQEILEELCKEEERISFKRRILHGKIDILRAELLERLKKKRESGQSVISGADVKRLSEILARGATGVSKVDLSEGEDKE